MPPRLGVAEERRGRVEAPQADASSPSPVPGPAHGQTLSEAVGTGRSRRLPASAYGVVMPLDRVRRLLARTRSRFYARPGGARIWRAGVAGAGLVVVLVGIVLLPAPGPGWLIIFAGLGIWATEFAWARSLLLRVRRLVGTWTAWAQRQPRWVAAVVSGAGLLMLAGLAAGAWWMFDQI